MATVSFSYRSKKDTANIEIRLTYEDNQKRKSIYTRSKLEVSKSFWDKYKKGTNFRDVDLSNLKTEADTHLNNLRAFLLSEYEKALEINKEWFTDAVKRFYTPKEKTAIPDELLPYLDYYLEIRKHDIKNKKTSIDKWRTIRGNLQKLQTATNRRYRIQDVNDHFVNEFIEYFQSEAYAAATIKKIFKLVKTLCRHAKAKGIQTSLEFDTLRINLKPENLPKIYLSFEELERINALNELPEHLDNAKDWLIISCYTGQRISDFMKFDQSMIRSAKNARFIDFKQVKTGKEMTVPILPIIETILDKRSGQFPRPISDQRYNDYIKEICRIAGINEATKGKITVNTGTKEETKLRKVIGVYEKWELISSHAGRRSFATNYYGKLPTSYIKDITGHSTEAMLLKYIGKTSKDTAFEAYELMLNVK